MLNNTTLLKMVYELKYTWMCIAHLRKQHHICLYSQSQSITALWSVLIAPTHVGMARLS